MNIDLTELSLAELHDLIANTQQALTSKQKQARKQVIAEIHALAESVGITVVIQEEGQATRSKVAPKYRNPDQPTQTWSGRGVKPRWLAALVNAGHDPQEFLI
jgi:DNA-binding protein H-NS